MRAHILAGVTLTIFLGVQAAYPQAAAESVLLNGNSAGATVKAGSALGKAFNKASGKLGNQVQKTVVEPSGMSVKIERTPRTPASPAAPSAAPKTSADSKTTPKPAPSGGSLITSIQGGRITHSSSSAEALIAK
jgi:hypothetical protein